MRTWTPDALDVEPSRPRILSSGDAGRAIAIDLPAGEALADHQVHEQAWVVVIAGEVELEADGTTVAGGVGTLAEFAPGERHEVRARTDARLLLLLTPWPGDGHPGAMSLDEKSHARDLARDRAS